MKFFDWIGDPPALPVTGRRRTFTVREFFPVPSCACGIALPIRPSRPGFMVIGSLCTGCRRFNAYGPDATGERPLEYWTTAIDQATDLAIDRHARYWYVRHRLTACGLTD